MPVLKQTSPSGAGWLVCAPKPRPQNTAPSASTSAAVAPGGTSLASRMVGSVVPPGRSDSVRPVAAITAAQWRDGMEPAWRHFRTASVPTPVRRAAASAPPSRSMIESTSVVMLPNLWEAISQCNRYDGVWEILSGNSHARHFAYSRRDIFCAKEWHEPEGAIYRAGQGIDE